MATNTTNDPQFITKNKGPTELLHLGYTYHHLHPKNDGTSIFKCIHENCNGSILVKKRKNPSKDQQTYKFISIENEHKNTSCKSDPIKTHHPNNETIYETNKTENTDGNESDVEELQLYTLDQTIYVNIQSEIKLIQTNKTDEKNLLKLIKYLFKKLYQKYDELEKTQIQVNNLSATLSYNNSEFENKTTQYESRIKNLLEEETENEEFNRLTIKKLNEEISNLKGQVRDLNNKFDITTTQDFFPTAQTKQYADKDIFYTPKTPKLKTNTKVSLHTRNLSPLFQSTDNLLEQSQTIQTPPNTLITTSTNNNNEKVIEKLNIIHGKIDEIKKLVESKKEEANNESIKPIEAKKQPENNTQKTSRTQPILKSNNPVPSIIENVDVLIIGDHHAKQLKTSLTKKLPNHLKIDDIIIDKGGFPLLSTLKKTKSCSHLILMAGTHDIQVTPMLEIKESIDKIIRQYKAKTIDFIQIPDRFDNVNMNYHINRVNKSIYFHMKKYRNVRNLRTSEIINNWDYNKNVNLNWNGINKLCRELSNNITNNTSKQPQHFHYSTPRDEPSINYNQIKLKQKNTTNNNQHQFQNTAISKNFRPHQYNTKQVSWKHQERHNQKSFHPVFSYQPESSKQPSYEYEYDVDYPPYRSRVGSHQGYSLCRTVNF